MSVLSKIGVGVIGLGHWGPNHLRVLSQMPDVRVCVASDLSHERRMGFQSKYPEVAFSELPSEVLNHPEVQAVVIATPTQTHFELTQAALLAGKHVLLEKPMCSTLEEAYQLLDTQKKTKRILVHGHIFLHNAGIIYLKNLVRDGQLGRIQYMDSTRTNLGPIRRDVNVVQDLVAHEFSIFDYIFSRMPLWIAASGSRLIGTSREDVAFLSMEYPGGILAHVHASWLHPKKIRQLTIVGDQKMAVWDDMNFENPISVFNKGVMEEPYYDSFGEFQLKIRDQEVHVPKIQTVEPLRAQAEAFIEKIKSQKVDLDESRSGLRVMKCLSAANRSLANEGQRIYIKEE